MKNEEMRRAALEEIQRNIAEHGLHLYGVTGGGTPHFAYTVGLSETLGAELILAGTYYYELDDVSNVVRSIIDNLKPGVAWERERFVVGPWGTFSFRKVDKSWRNALMLGAVDYYAPESVNAYQIVPDREHWTIDVPDLSEPLGSEVAPGWRWIAEEWSYPVARDSMATTDLQALRGARITEAIRWEEDYWGMFSGGPDTPESETRAIPLGVLLAFDESLLPALRLPVGGALRRDEGSDWQPFEGGA